MLSMYLIVYSYIYVCIFAKLCIYIHIEDVLGAVYLEWLILFIMPSRACYFLPFRDRSMSLEPLFHEKLWSPQWHSKSLSAPIQGGSLTNLLNVDM